MKTKTSNDISILEEKILQASTDSERGSAIAELACSVKYSDPERAVSLSDQVIELSLTADLKTVLPKCYLSKAIGLLHMSRFKVAEKSAKMGLTSCRQLDDQTGVRNALNVLASIYFRRSKYAAALEHYLESLEIHKQLTSTSDPGILSNIGAVYLQLGDTDRALDYFTQVKMLENEINESADLKASISLNMGRIYSRMGMYDDALEHLKEGYEIYLTNDMKQAAASTADSIGNAMMELGRYDEAMEHFKTAISSFTSFDDLKGEALVLSNMGKCCLLQESGKAMELYLESLKKFRFLRDSHGIAEALIGISLVMIDLGRNDVALDRLNEAYSIAEKEELKPQLSEIHKYLASILENEGKFDTAYQHLMIHSDIEKSLRSERVANSLINLRVINHTERTRKEMTTCLLRNIELEKEKDELEEILRLSEDEHKEDGIQQEIPLETGKQQEEGTDSEEELQMLIDRVCSIANDLKDSLTFATGQVEQAIVDKTLSERTEKQLHLTIDSLRDSIPLTEQLLSLVNPENGYTEVPGSTLLDVFTNKPVSKYKTGSRVLIVEDTQDIKELLVANLEGYGYSVVASTSFMNAKDIISKSINDIGCIIIDVVLNDGSGIDLIRAAHESKPLLPILAGSAYPLSSSDLEYLKKDGISLISKPYKIDTLLLKLSTILPL